MMQLVAQRFVYIEDHPDQRDLFATEFSYKRHWNPITCLPGVRAFGAYLAESTEPIDVLIVDWRLKDGTGADVIRMARQHPRTKAAAILSVSAVSEERQIAEADQVGAHYWLEKPLTVDLIKDALQFINGFGEVIVKRKASAPESARSMT
jgi:DNA-binding response OmpR family regulator